MDINKALELVRPTNGRINMDSAGRGTSVKIYLPPAKRTLVQKPFGESFRRRRE